MLMNRIFLAFTGLALCVSTARGQQLVDDFTRANGTTVGNGWTEGGWNTTLGVATASAAILSNALDIPTGGVSGRDWVSRDVSGLYVTTLNSNSCVLTWQFNMKTSRADPSGFATGNYGNAFILAGSALDPATGTGYAVIHGEGGATDRLRLVRYSAGVATNTSVIAGTSDFGAEYLAVRVVYTPSTNNWQLYSASNGASFPAPATAAFSEGSAVDATYTGTSLPYTACYFQHNTAAADRATFDNVSVPLNCTSTIATFATPSGSALEDIGTVQVTINFSAVATVAGTYTITVANGAGATYGGGGDYTTVPAVAASTITVPVAVGATDLTFDIVVNDDITTEANETITFTITGASAGLYIGAATTYVQTIIDNDATPTVSMATLSVNAVETAGSVNFLIDINPAPAVAGTVALFVSDGVGVTYGAGGDYTTTPGVSLSQITVNIPIGATSVSFTVNVINDVLIESTEAVGFSILSVSGGFAVGAPTAASLQILDNDSPPTVLGRGDLVVVGVNANRDASCGGPTVEDEVSFFCFKDITTGTTIDITDNGYERCFAGQWGNTEGTIRASRTGPTIPRGTVITFRMPGSGGYYAVAPDASWGFTSLNGATNYLNLNSGGDQLFFGQGGVWNQNTVAGNNATYSGTWLFGFSTNSAVPWTASCGTTPTQRSNLPLGMDCFSMAPTSATDYSKYVGPQSIATQRDWILRIEDPLNWFTYTNCFNYNGGGTDWTTAPVMPITLGGMVNGLWTGAKSTDWFQCQNWDDAEVPIAASTVAINSTAQRNCVVGLVAGSAAVCASINHIASSVARDLTVQQSSTLTVGGPINVQRTLGSGPVGITLLGGSTLTCTNLTLQGTGAGLYEGYVRNLFSANTLTVSGNLTIQPGGLLDLQGAGQGGLVRLGGNWNNNHDNPAFMEGFSTVLFNGTGAQSINTSSVPEVFSTLRISKTSNDVTLNRVVVISTNLDLLQGRLFTDATNCPIVLDNATATNASDASFVHGPIDKEGNDNFTFPVGKGTQWRYAGISSVTGTNGRFRCEYFPADPEIVFGTPLEPTLDHISNCEYWIIDRTAGLENSWVTLSWDDNSCGVTNLADLRVARWDAPGTIWRDRGNGLTTGTTAAGDIITSGIQTLFGPFTLASVNSGNPLPIELLSFNARPQDEVVLVDWSTATEIDNLWFDVERSADGSSFTSIDRLPGAINSQATLNYSTVDETPLGGTSYYRLRQTDLDGTSTTSNVVTVVRGGANGRPIAVVNNGDALLVYHGMAAGAQYTVLDAGGRVVLHGTVASDGPFGLDMSHVTAGAYMLRMWDGSGVAVGRFVR